MAKRKRKNLLSAHSLRSYIDQKHKKESFRSDGLELLNETLEGIVDRVAGRGIALAAREDVTTILQRHIAQAVQDTIVSEITVARIIEVILQLEAADLENIAQAVRHSSTLIETDKLVALLTERVTDKIAENQDEAMPLEVAQAEIENLAQLRKLRGPGEEALS